MFHIETYLFTDLARRFDLAFFAWLDCWLGQGSNGELVGAGVDVFSIAQDVILLFGS